MNPHDKTCSWRKKLNKFGRSDIGRLFFSLLLLIGSVIWLLASLLAIAVIKDAGFIKSITCCGIIFGLIFAGRKAYFFIKNKAAKSGMSKIKFLSQYPVLLINGLFLATLLIRFFNYYSNRDYFYTSYEYHGWSYYQFFVIYLLAIISITLERWRRANLPK